MSEATSSHAVGEASVVSHAVDVPDYVPEGQEGWCGPIVEGNSGAARTRAANGPVTEILPAHQFPGKPQMRERVRASHPTVTEDDPLDRRPELRAYRARTVAMLRRYLRYSLDTGRVPSILGGQYFRSGVTSYGMTTFEDRVIFVHDMEICLDKLGELSRQVIARYVLQEHTCRETARLLHCAERTIRRSIPLALDQFSEILLSVGLLDALSTMEKETCQEGERDEILASDCELDK